jgi:enoyl-CoA hydratase/carnithine racemase
MDAAMTGLAPRQLVDGVGIISFNRPDRHNALNDALVEEWQESVRWAIADPDVRCILLRGEGRSFSSGRDTKELGQRANGESDYEFVQRAQAIRLEMLEVGKPVLAAVRGFVFGGAFETALAADMRMAADDTVFAFPEIQFGLIADTGGTQLLTPLIGPAKAKYLLLTGDRLDAATALEWGVVDWVVPAAELDGAALELAAKLAAAPPMAAALTKRLVDHAWAGSVRSGIRQELIAQTALFAGAEHKETKEARLRELRKDVG